MFFVTKNNSYKMRNPNQKLFSKILLLLLTVVLIIGCQKEIETKYLKNNMFITEAGKYYFKSTLLEIKEFQNGTLVVGLKKGNKIYYSQNIFTAFSKYQQWFIFIDEKDWIWIYNSDYQELILLEKREDDYFINPHFNKNFMPAKIREKLF